MAGVNPPISDKGGCGGGSKKIGKEAREGKRGEGEEVDKGGDGSAAAETLDTRRNERRRREENRREEGGGEGSPSVCRDRRTLPPRSRARASLQNNASEH